MNYDIYMFLEGIINGICLVILYFSLQYAFRERDEYLKLKESELEKLLYSSEENKNG